MKSPRSSPSSPASSPPRLRAARPVAADRSPPSPRLLGWSSAAPACAPRWRGAGGSGSASSCSASTGSPPPSPIRRRCRPGSAGSRWCCSRSTSPSIRPPRPASPGAGARRAGSRSSSLLAAAWIVTEWLRATLFTGFAWNPVGVVLLPTPARLARDAGSAPTAFRRRRPARRRRCSCWPAALAEPAAALRRCAIAGARPGRLARRAGTAPPAAGPPLRIVQPNIGQQDKWDPGSRRENFARLAALSGRPAREPRLLLWPEAAVTDRSRTACAIPATRRGAGAARGRRAARPARPAAARRRRPGVRPTAAASPAPPTASSRSTPAAGSSAATTRRISSPMANICRCGRSCRAIGLSRLAPGDLDFHAGPGPRTLDLPRLRPGRLPGLLRDHLLGRGGRPRATGPTSSSTPRTTPGSAPGARRSISPRRGCGRSRRGCR